MTDNHGFDTPEQGTSDWAVPLNRNFERLDTAVEVRDQDGERDTYEPKAGAKFYAVDTGNVYVGTGSEWSRVPVATHDHQQLAVADSLRLPVTDSAPDSPSAGELWFRRDAGEVRVQTANGTLTLGGSAATDGDPSFDVTEPFEDASWVDTFGDVWDYGVDANCGVTDVAGRDGTDEGAGGNPASGTGWSARMGWDDPGSHGDGIALDWYIYHMDASGSYGHHDYWGKLLNEGQWYDIEQYIDLGTPGENDGVLQGWVDGSLEYERTDLRFRETGGNDVQWSWLDFYHGGGNTPSGDVSVQFDDFSIVRGGKP